MLVSKEEIIQMKENQKRLIFIGGGTFGDVVSKPNLTNGDLIVYGDVENEITNMLSATNSNGKNLVVITFGRGNTIATLIEKKRELPRSRNNQISF